MYACPHKQDWTWAAQWMDDDGPPTFSRVGWHYRGFSMVKVCNDCKRKLQEGQTITVIRKRQPYTLRLLGTPLVQPAQEVVP
jgi:hypothetical protein